MHPGHEEAERAASCNRREVQGDLVALQDCGEARHETGFEVELMGTA
ncbi:hypothetical protein ACFPRL_35875 [Pseudoclavibacter helvolus]